MGTGRTLNKTPRTRPIKTPGEKRRRTKAQTARLAKLGVTEETLATMQPEVVRKLARLVQLGEAAVAKMQPEAVRRLVQRPTKVKTIVAVAAEK